MYMHDTGLQEALQEPGMGWGRREGEPKARWRGVSSEGREGRGKEANTHVNCTSMFFMCSASNSS